MAEPGRSHRPRKRFGQNFLTDSGVIDRILAAIHPRSDDAMVEIGPGLGALTRPLVESGAQLTLVELDRDLIAELQMQFGNNPRVRILNADALQTDFSALAEGRQLRIVGNLPYNISTPLLFHLMDHLPAIADMHFMLQREVVERISAMPGGSDWGRLGIMLQARCATEQLLDVPATAFDPAPKVQSAVVRLTPLPQQLPAALLAALEKVVRTAFSSRRKTLRNGLKSLFDAAQLEALQVDPQARAESLRLEDFLRLAGALSAP